MCLDLAILNTSVVSSIHISIVISESSKKIPKQVLHLYDKLICNAKNKSPPYHAYTKIYTKIDERSLFSIIYANWTWTKNICANVCQNTNWGRDMVYSIYMASYRIYFYMPFLYKFNFNIQLLFVYLYKCESSNNLNPHPKGVRTFCVRAYTKGAYDSIQFNIWPNRTFIETNNSSYSEHLSTLIVSSV